MKIKFTVIFFFVLVATSCEDVIELDLDNGDPRIVIEGIVTDQPGPHFVEITRSASFYDTNTFPPVSDAQVTITDDLGNEEPLEEIVPGVYHTAESFQGVPGVTYTLTVEVDGVVYQASSKIPEQRVEIDSVIFEYYEASLFRVEGYYATVYFNDPPDVENYYRLNVFVNGKPFIFDFNGEMFEDDNFWLSNDKYTDGNLQNFDFPHVLDEGDQYKIELHHLNRGTYDYYRTLTEILDGSGVAPSNPLSNFENALGYFGAFSVTSKSEQVD